MSEDVLTGFGIRFDRSLLGLIARFTLYSVALFTVMTYLDVHTSLLSDLRVVTAKIASDLIQATGIPASQVGTYIRIPNRMLLISDDCTGIFIAGIFSSLVLSYPVRFSLRVWGIVAGVAVIAVANLARLTLVAILSIIAPASFSFSHDFLFQVGMALVPMAVWASWLVYARNHAQ